MGIFDKVRSIKNAITGGGAKVSIDVGQCRIGMPFDVHVKVEVDEDDLKINGARLQILGKEIVEIIGSDARLSAGEDIDLSDKLVSAEHTTVSLDIEVAGEQTLAANQTYDWTVTAEIPDGVQPLFKGKFCQHSFVICASLDCFGNDPDSGWIDLAVSP